MGRSNNQLLSRDHVALTSLQGYNAVGTVFTFAVMGVWRQGFHTRYNEREARKRETTVTSVCVKESKGTLVNASWLTKGNKMTRDVQNFTSLDFRN